MKATRRDFIFSMLAGAAVLDGATLANVKLTGEAFAAQPSRGNPRNCMWCRKPDM